MKRRSILPLVLALAAVPALADHRGSAVPASPSAPMPAASVGGTDPKAISTPAPAFPAGLKDPKHARVVLQLDVLADGRISDVKVFESGGEAAYDKAALAAAKTWKFSPATDADGKPVDATIRVPLTFDPGTGWADIGTQMQKILKQSCRDLTAELAAWRKQNPDGELEDMPTFKASTGFLYAMAFTSPMDEMLQLTGHMRETLPGVYAKIADECVARPDAVYENVWAASLKDASKATR